MAAILAGDLLGHPFELQRRLAFLHEKSTSLLFNTLTNPSIAVDAKLRLRTFWGAITYSDARRHSLQRDTPTEFTIQRWIHGGGVPRTETGTLEVSSWGSMLSTWLRCASG